jgi:hypothetical protein
MERLARVWEARVWVEGQMLVCRVLREGSKKSLSSLLSDVPRRGIVGGSRSAYSLVFVLAVVRAKAARITWAIQVFSYVIGLGRNPLNYMLIYAQNISRNDNREPMVSKSPSG